MRSITVLAVGRLKERFFESAAKEYEKRLGAFCSISVVELPEQRLPDNPSEAQIKAALSKEAAAVRKKLPKSVFLCLLTPEGRMLFSEELAGAMTSVSLSGTSAAAFVLGGSYGLDEGLKREADLLLSMSRMTFPHHMARVMLLEQLYRAQSIMAGTKYHK